MLVAVVLWGSGGGNAPVEEMILVDGGYVWLLSILDCVGVRIVEDDSLGESSFGGPGEPDVVTGTKDPESARRDI